MTFGSNELIYVPGSPLPIMLEEMEEEEEESPAAPPSAPPRTKVARTPKLDPPPQFECLQSFYSEPVLNNTPECVPRKKVKSKPNPECDSYAFVDPVKVPDVKAEPDDVADKTPQTLPRTRRGQNKQNPIKTSCETVSPPPRMYTTIPPRTKTSSVSLVLTICFLSRLNLSCLNKPSTVCIFIKGFV